MDAMGYIGCFQKYSRVDIMHLNSCNSMKHLCYFLFSTPRWFFLDFDRDTEYRKDPRLLMLQVGGVVTMVGV